MEIFDNSKIRSADLGGNLSRSESKFSKSKSVCDGLPVPVSWSGWRIYIIFHRRSVIKFLVDGGVEKSQICWWVRGGPGEGGPSRFCRFGLWDKLVSGTLRSEWVIQNRCYFQSMGMCGPRGAASGGLGGLTASLEHDTFGKTPQNSSKLAKSSDLTKFDK